MGTDGVRPAWARWGALLAVAFLVTSLWQRVVVFDEGYAAYGAWRIREGAWPYADFFCNYAPGSFCVNAAAMALLGIRLVSLRIVDLAVKVGIALACGTAARAAGAGRWSWLAYGAALVLPASLGMAGYCAQPALLTVLLASMAWLRALGGGGRRWAAVAGVGAGLTLFLRQDFGAYLLVALAIHAAAAAWTGRAEAGRRLALALALALTLAAALYAPFLVVAGPARLWHDLVLQDLALVHGPYALPLPGLGGLRASLAGLLRPDGEALDQGQVWVSLVVGGLLLLDAFVGWLREARPGRRGPLAPLWYALLGFGFLRQGLNRADMVHFYPLALTVAVLLSALLGSGGRLRHRLVAAVFGVYFIAAPLKGWLGYVRTLPAMPASRLERAAGLPLDPGLDAAVSLVHAGTRPGEPIFVANAAAGSGLSNNILFYFLAGRPCAAYHEMVLRPVTEAYLRDVDAAVASSATAAVVLWNGYHTGLGTLPRDRARQAFGCGGLRMGDYEVHLRRPPPPDWMPRSGGS